MKSTAHVFLMLTVFATAGCGAAAPAVDPEAAVNMPTVPLAEISSAEWEALASRRIFFGHQSVVRDIMLGMERVLARNPQIPLVVVQSDDPSAVEGPAFVEARIGRNREPQTKTDAFLAALSGGFGAEQGAVAMYKFCYVDVNEATDPELLFTDYEKAVEHARSTYPGLTIVHFTLPLHAAPDGVREKVMTRVSAKTQTRLNVTRSRYNDMLRRRYAAADPIFDLARLESTRADGSLAYTQYRGEKVPMLAPEWTYDGGHLTDEAQDHIAERLLVFLARLDDNRSTIANAAGSAR